MHSSQSLNATAEVAFPGDVGMVTISAAVNREFIPGFDDLGQTSRLTRG